MQSENSGQEKYMEYRGELAGALARGNHAGGRPSREVARKIILFRLYDVIPMVGDSWFREIGVMVG